MESLNNLEELKKKVTSKVDKMKLMHILWMCLKFVIKNDDAKTQIGLFWIDDSIFLMNTTIFGAFIERIPNTINRNLRSHGFGYKKTTYEMRTKININLPDSNHWILRWCDGFTQSTTENEAISWKYNDEYVRKPEKIRILKEVETPVKVEEDKYIELNISNYLDENEMLIFENPKNDFDSYSFLSNESNNMDISFDYNDIFSENGLNLNNIIFD